MTYRTVAVALTAALLAAILPTQTAHAEDRRPCVSKVEYHSGFGPITYTRRELETRWDVRGMGVRVPSAFNVGGLLGERTFTIAYPRCAFPMDVAYYSVTYLTRDQTVAATNSHRVHGVPPHGHL